MKPQTAKTSQVIPAPAEQIYEILADYRTKHPLILPKPYFLSLDVEEGGTGAGTIVNFKMRVLGRTQSFRSLITEPEPGRTLLEMDLNSGVSTRFEVLPLEAGPRTLVTISTVLRNRGYLEGLLAKWLLQRIYRQELNLLASLVREGSTAAPAVSTDAAPS